MKRLIRRRTREDQHAGKPRQVTAAT
jgi:hypothetical protein